MMTAPIFNAFIALREETSQHLRSTKSKWIASVYGMALMLTVAGCGTASVRTAKPDWVDGPAKDYPAEMYLVGRGDADSVAQAQERARADLAKIFEVAVTSEGSDVQTSKSEAGAVRYESRVEQRVFTRSEKVISGIRIAELWNAPALEKGGNGRQHALAVLPRLQAVTALREDIAARDEAIARNINRAQATPDGLDRAGIAHHALALAQERVGLVQSLRVLSPVGSVLESPYSVTKLQGDLAEQLKRIVLRVTVQTDGILDASSLKSATQGAIASSGFRTEPSGADNEAIYEARVTARLTEASASGWFWVRGNIELSLVDGAGRARGAQSWPVKASAQDNKHLGARTMLEIERMLKESLRPAVLGFVANPK